jgi:ATP-dependent RNA helicase DOB1
MDTDALFSFLDEDQVDHNNDGSQPMPIDSAPEKSAAKAPKKKRKAESARATPNASSSKVAVDPEPVPKKARIQSPEQENPVVLDEFETVAKREVAANAGLSGAPTAPDQRLELRHQVSTRLDTASLSNARCLVGQTSGCRTTRLQLRSHLPTCLST